MLLSSLLHRFLVLYVAVRFCLGLEFVDTMCEGVNLTHNLFSLQKLCKGTQSAPNSRGSCYLLSPVNHLIFFLPTYHACKNYLLQFFCSLGGPFQLWQSQFCHRASSVPVLGWWGRYWIHSGLGVHDWNCQQCSMPKCRQPDRQLVSQPISYRMELLIVQNHSGRWCVLASVWKM